MRLKPGLLNRLQRRRPLLRVAIDHCGAQADFPHLQPVDSFQRLADSPDTFSGLHPLDSDLHNPY